LALSAAGCATVHGATKDNASFAKYKKVYLLKFHDDPRRIMPNVQQRLAALGFEVVVADEHSPIGGRQGTGFIISPDGYLLTSAHVVGKQPEATVWLDGTQYAAEVVYAEGDVDDDEDPDDEDLEELEDRRGIKAAMEASLNSKRNRPIDEDISEQDLALLKIQPPGQPLTVASFAREPEYRMGQEVYTIGYPLTDILGDKPRLNKGLISSTVGIRDNPQFVQMSAEIQPGNSGGPLLNQDGQVVGIVQMTLDPMSVLEQTGSSLPQNVNFAAKQAVITEFLARAKEKAAPSLRQGEAMPFDEVQRAIVQVHSGRVPEGFKQEPKLVCAVSYSYLGDVWHRFQTLDIVFHDHDTQEALLRAGQYGDNAFSTEDRTLDHVFREIKAKMGR
jgi:S1-C subfamily serine protease